MQVIFTVCYLCCATGLGVGEFSVHLFCPACEAESRISCMFQIPETFSPLSSVCFRFWRLFHRCLLYVSDAGDFFTAVFCMFQMLETFSLLSSGSVYFRFRRLFHHCLLYVLDSGDLFFTSAFCMFQIPEAFL